MGSTVTCGRFVAAFRDNNAQTLYALYEQTYEKNVHPHTPHWSCFYFGRFEGALQNIFEAASSCEGGMLQNRSGRITPEGYLASWFKELAAPHLMADRKIELKVGNYWDAAVPAATVDAAAAALDDAGLPDEAQNLRGGGSAYVQLHEHADLIVSLIEAGQISRWRAFNSAYPDLNAPIADELGYKPIRAKRYDIEIPHALAVTADDRLLPAENGAWRHAGWIYSIVGSYISNLWRDEMKTPGCFRKRIGAYRDAIAQAPPAPDGTRVVVTRRAGEQKYTEDARVNFAKKHPVTPSPDGFSVIVTPENITDLCWLDRDTTRWFLPQPACATPSPVPTISSSGTVQAGLFLRPPQKAMP